MTQDKSMTKYKANWTIRSKKVHESKANPWTAGQNMKRNIVITNAGISEARGQEGRTPSQIFRPSNTPAKFYENNSAISEIMSPYCEFPHCWS